MNIAVGSTNKAKIKAVQSIYHEMNIHVSIIPIKSPSGVSDMPFSDIETMKGATNRAEYCLHHTNADIAFGLEGGVMETPFGLYLCNWGALAERGKSTLLAGGARIVLPEDIAERLRGGTELGPLMDEYSKLQNVSSNEGAIGIFTNGFVDRSDMFGHIIKLLIGQKERRDGSIG